MSSAYKGALFARGDVVRMRSTPDTAGQVVAEEEWGARYGVRLAGSVEVEWFENVELEHMPVKEPVSNVIPVDFTRGVRLGGNTKTKGRA